MSETSEVTTLEKAAPIINPNATSITLSRPRNAAAAISNAAEQNGRLTREVAPEPSCASPDAVSSREESLVDVFVDVGHHAWITAAALAKGHFKSCRSSTAGHFGIFSRRASLRGLGIYTCPTRFCSLHTIPALREALYITSLVINVDVIVVRPCAQPRDCRKIPRQNDDKPGSPRNSEIPNRNLEPGGHTLCIGISRE